MRVLRLCGFSMLRDADVAEVIVAQPDAEGAGGMQLKYRVANRDTNEEIGMLVEDGTAKIAQLREMLGAIWSTCKNCHWGTVTDVAALQEELDIGFIIFSNTMQGRNQWIYGVHPKKRSFPFWITLYCRNVQHFLLAEVYDAEQGAYTSFFSDHQLPAPLRAHWELCNPAPEYAGGSMS